MRTGRGKKMTRNLNDKINCIFCLFFKAQLASNTFDCKKAVVCILEEKPTNKLVYIIPVS